MAIEDVLAQLSKLQKSGIITAWIEVPAREGEYADFPTSLDVKLTDALKTKGISSLYSHQARAVEEAAAGRHVVVVTPTASGKTLCYNLPVLNTMLREPEARALYLFPTKALAQDQMFELQTLEKLLDAPIGVQTYDGDTPADRRRKVRDQARIILTNPDMLNAALLPHHPRWRSLFSNLRYVVVDELHTYRGIFGSHIANLFRRLKRITRFYGSEIQFICASATIANPEDLASRLLEEDVACIQESGAPRAPKDLILINPPLINQQLGLRRSALSMARRVAERFLKANVQTLVFATSRVNVEVLLSYLKKALAGRPSGPEQVRGYRGGYLPLQRREIERQLREREILGVVSTNALELGVDIGSLDVCILTGYPGSIASTWQQMGRAGRRRGRSASILIARNLPLDQFIVQHPEYFLERSPEHARIHPDNLQILLSHIKCAAFELPFNSREQFGKENLVEILEFLAEEKVLFQQGTTWHWASGGYPTEELSLRNIPDRNFAVIDVASGHRTIAEVDFNSAPELIHQGAIYLCDGRQYHVDELDYEGRRALVREVEVDYYTEAVSFSKLRILGTEQAEHTDRAIHEYGEVHLSKSSPAFKKIKFYTFENLGYGSIDIPAQEWQTTGYWLTAGEVALLESGLTRTQALLGLLGLAYALNHVAALLLMCDVRDIGRSVGDRSSQWFAQMNREGIGIQEGSTLEAIPDPGKLGSFDPTIFLYDNAPGGVGLAEMMFEKRASLLFEARQLIQFCGCQAGCPSCVGAQSDTGEAVKEYALNVLACISGTAAEAIH